MATAWASACSYRAETEHRSAAVDGPKMLTRSCENHNRGTRSAVAARAIRVAVRRKGISSRAATRRQAALAAACEAACGCC